ncbi:MAG: hypothetical protein GVY02_05935 [Bacteroidetes bacterium]|nr:hypothetical protein [Bacteroidota bacterium]
MTQLLKFTLPLLVACAMPDFFLSAQPQHLTPAGNSSLSDSLTSSVSEIPFRQFKSQLPDQMPVWNPMEGPFIPSYKPPRSLILNMPVFGLQDSLRMRSGPHPDKYLTPRKRKP